VTPDGLMKTAERIFNVKRLKALRLA